VFQEYWSPFDIDGFCSVGDEIMELEETAKLKIREFLIMESSKFLDIPYEFGAEWTDFTKSPTTIDCSELFEGLFHRAGLNLPDGSQNQYNDTISAKFPKPGDLAFFGRGGKENRIYHVGMLYSNSDIIEARGYQPTSSFETGKVILRDRGKWEGYKNFLGYRCHKKLC